MIMPEACASTTDKLFVIVDYGMGNLKSVLNALRFLGCNALISNKAEDIERANAVILPGVGAFREAMDNLKQLGLVDALNKQILENKKPFLGICLGMQLIAKDSEEKGYYKGLGWIDGNVRRIAVRGGQRLPHIGWNNITILKENPLFTGISSDFNFYFVHSYHLQCNESCVSAECNYGIDVAAALQKKNIFAVQFHPEKSQSNGLRLLRNFINAVESYKLQGGNQC